MKKKRGITFRKFLLPFQSVRMKGLEPPRPESLDPKSNAATNYATCADDFVDAKVRVKVELCKYIGAKVEIFML